MLDASTYPIALRLSIASPNTTNSFLLRLPITQNARQSIKEVGKQGNMAQHDRKYLGSLAGLLETFSPDLRLYE
jgi:hypothetical protein